VLPSHGVRRLRRRKRVRRYLTSSRRRTEKGTAVVVAVVVGSCPPRVPRSSHVVHALAGPETAALTLGDAVRFARELCVF
jgi:hypothetical protein